MLIGIAKRGPFGSLLIALLTLCARVAAAQYHVQSWTTENGLPQNVVGAIHQTRDGYLWLATRDGLVRFDGVRFTVFDRNNSPGIRNNRFTVLYEAANGAIWAGTEGGGVTRHANGVFVTYTTQDGLPNSQVYGVTGDAAGQVWVVSAGQIMQWDGTRFHPAPTNGVTAPFYASHWNSQVFWAIDAIGLHRFTAGQFSVRPFPAALQKISNNRFEEDADGTLWMGTLDRRVARIRGSDVRFAEIPDLTAEEGQLPLAFRDRTGHEWPLTVSRALVRMWSFPDARERPVAVGAILEDREGNLWLGTDGSGLYRIRQPQVTVYSREQGLIGHNIYPVHTDRAGSVWVGAWPSGLSRIANGRVENYTVADGLASGFVTSLAEDRQGRLWVASGSDRNGGLRVLDHGRFRDVEETIVPPHASVHAILHDRSGTLWVGTNVGLAQSQGGSVRLLTTADGLGGNDVNAIIEDTDGRIWPGTDGGATT